MLRALLIAMILLGGCDQPPIATQKMRLPPSQAKVSTGSTQFRVYRYALHGLMPTSIAKLDIFDRGVNDLAVANAGSSTVSLYKNNGDGTFQFYSELASCAGGDSISAEPLTGSGHFDFFVTCNSSAMLSLFTGDGQGHFLRHDLPVAASPIGAQSAPHGDSSSTPYLAVLHDQPAMLELLYHRGQARFVREKILPVPAAPTQFIADSFTGDGTISYAIVSAAESKFSVYLRRGNEIERRDYDGPESADSIATVDLKGTGYNNLIVGSSTQRVFRIYENDRTGHFSSYQEYEVPRGRPGGFGTSHLRGVPQSEVITQTSSGAVVIYPHLGNGRLGEPEVVNADGGLIGMITGSFIHHSDDMDVAMIDSIKSELVILLNEHADY